MLNGFLRTCVLPGDEPSLKIQPFPGTIPACDVWVGVGGQPGLAWPESQKSVCSGVESTNVTRPENGTKTPGPLVLLRAKVKKN